MMTQTEVKELLGAGVHFGHLTRKWNPNMAPYIYMERNGIHILNLYKTAAKINEAQKALKKIALSGRKILFVATKKQAKDIVAGYSKKISMPYITERWPGGMLTNFVTIRKAVKKMSSIDKMKKDGTFETLSKKEKLQVDRMRSKLEKNLGSITDMTRLPGAVFVVDIKRESIAVKEAQKLNIPIFAMVDTNSDPRKVDFVIPSNDDASKSIDKIISLVTASIAEGLSERKTEKEAELNEKNQSNEEIQVNQPNIEDETKLNEDVEGIDKVEVKKEVKTKDKVEDKKEAKTKDKVEDKKEAKTKVKIENKKEVKTKDKVEDKKETAKKTKTKSKSKTTQKEKK
ncbi:MAG: 30S ribosomal protein S2 [Flavobacteriaceae bacterium]|nr:30S ribosomal protein S2 [Flavobacteriaceae bacterium]